MSDKKLQGWEFYEVEDNAPFMHLLVSVIALLGVCTLIVYTSL